MTGKKGLGELLVRENLIDIEQLEQARKQQKQHGGRLTSSLVSLGYINEKKLAEFLGNEYQLATVDLSQFEIDGEALKMLSKQICQKHCVIPVSKAGSSLVVAFSDPSNIYVKDDISLLTRSRVEVVVASEIAIIAAIEKYYNAASVNQFANIVSEIEDHEDFKMDEMASDVELVDQVPDGSDDIPVIKFVNAMLTEAIKLRASDIHVEPYEKRFRIRFRIDGQLLEKTQPPQGAAGAIVSRLKIMSQMDIAERRRPQDGRMKVRLTNGTEIDFRVNATPTLFGEKVVLRILDKSNLQVDMKKLGFEPFQLDALQEAIHLPQGMVLITGPTGSGKTTTIYSALSELNIPTVNLSTAEDPVEFNLDGINQVQVNPEIGFTFAEALKAFLRQDPEVIMVGEIRDVDTANVAFKAASTGHLVVSTLHTNDAASTVARLIDMGVPHFMVSEAISLIVAQRLMKTNCKHCLTDVKVPREELVKLGVVEDKLDDYTSLKKGMGCDRCGNRGYAGRIAIIEVLKIGANLKNAIFQGASPLELKKQAISDGMLTLRQSALLKLQRGICTVEEVLNSTIGDDV